MKKCTYCAEEIQDEAIKCKHCKEWVGQPPRCPAQPISVRDFILNEGARAARIAKRLRPQMKRLLRARGLTLTCESLAYVWRLNMTKARPFIDIDEVERIVSETVTQLRFKDEAYEIKDGLLVTVVLEGQVKAAFYLSPRREGGK